MSHKRGFMYLLSLRVAIRYQMATAAAASSRICSGFGRAVLDKREANAVLHNGTTRTDLSHSFPHVAAPSPFCPTTAKRLRHVQRRCRNQRSLLLEKSSGVYDPEDLASLGNLFDRAIASLPTCMRTGENRVAIARLVMQRAARDELASLAHLMLALVSAD